MELKKIDDVKISIELTNFEFLVLRSSLVNFYIEQGYKDYDFSSSEVLDLAYSCRDFFNKELRVNRS